MASEAVELIDYSHYSGYANLYGPHSDLNDSEAGPLPGEPRFVAPEVVRADYIGAHTALEEAQARVLAAATSKWIDYAPSGDETLTRDSKDELDDAIAGIKVPATNLYMQDFWTRSYVTTNLDALMAEARSQMEDELSARQLDHPGEEPPVL